MIIPSSVALARFGWLRFGLHHIDRGGIKVGLDVRRVIFLDHLDAGAAVLGDLVDVGALHQAQADVGMAQAVGRPGPAVAVNPEIFFLQDRLELLPLPFRKKQIHRCRDAPRRGAVLVGIWCAPSPAPLSRVVAWRGRIVIGARRPEPGLQSLERAHGARHALAVADTALAAHFNFKDGLVAGVVLDDGRVPELQAAGLVRPQAGIGREKDKVVKLFRFPFVAVVPGLVRAFSGGLIELLVFLGRKPRPVLDFLRRPVGLGKIGQVVEPFVAQCGF